MMLKYNEITKEGFLWMGSLEIQKQQKRYDEEKAKKGAETGF